MSILIKGMEMPECCDKCWAINVYGDYPVCLITGETRGYNFRIRERRMDKCPLVEVPAPHGRLIDADDANSYAYDILETCHDMHPWEAAREMQKIFFRDAPTVIEAEE